jgi:hypothetical protein
VKVDRTLFIKLKIAAKEAEETKYWLSLCMKADSYPDPDGLLEKLHIIIKVLKQNHNNIEKRKGAIIGILSHRHIRILISCIT